MCCSLIIPGLALTFQRPMLDFNGIRAQPLRVHVAGVVALFVAVELLYLLSGAWGLAISNALDQPRHPHKKRV